MVQFGKAPPPQNGEFIENLEGSIKEALHFSNIKLGNRRIIVTIDAKGIKAKIVVPIAKKPKVSRRPPEVMQKIKEAKKVLKGKHDLIYVFTLLVSLDDELKKFDINQLSDEGRSTLMFALEKLNATLTSITKGVQKE